MDWMFPHYHCVHHLIRFLKLLPNRGMIPTWIRLRFPVLHHWFGTVLPALCQDMFNDVQCRLYGCDYGCVMAQLPLGFFLGDLVSVRLRICCFHVVGLESFVVVTWKWEVPSSECTDWLDYGCCRWLQEMGSHADGKIPRAIYLERKQVWPGAKRWRIRHVQSQKFGRNFKMSCFLQDVFFLEWLMS